MDDNRGDGLFEEKLLGCYLPGGWESFKKKKFNTYLARVINAFLIALFIAMLAFQLELNHLGAVSILSDFLSLFGISIVFLIGENFNKNGGVSSRPITVYSGGLTIPPIYLRALSKEKGFIHKGLIDHLEVRWHKEHTAYFSKVSSINWYDAPVEFVVHLKNGKAISSGKRPPETILEAVDTMERAWGIKVIRQGFKRGRMERIVNLETVEERDL